jgi:Polyketide cyclase / dehydrase and lipid transport
VITITVCDTIDAPRDRVWHAVERIETHTEWMKDAVRITFTSPQHSGVGASFECLTRVGPLFTTDRFVVTQWRPGEVMGIEHRGAVTGDAEFRIGAAPGDATRFCWEERLRFPWWLGGLIGEQVGKPILRHIWQGNVARLKASIERAG